MEASSSAVAAPAEHLGVSVDGFGNVTSWADQSGNGHDAIADTQPFARKGALGAVVAYDSALSSDNVSRVWVYLKNRFSLAAP